MRMKRATTARRVFDRFGNVALLLQVRHRGAAITHDQNYERPQWSTPATRADHRHRGPNGQESTLEARFNLPERGRSRVRYAVAVKRKQEAEFFKAALRAGIRYAESRGAVEFEPTDSASDKALYVYRLLVHDKIITPMPEDQVGEKTVRHRLASWYANLPPGHPLLS